MADRSCRGINETNLKMAKFRFNKPFHLIGAEEFLKDLCNDRTVLQAFSPLTGNGTCTGVKFQHLNCNALNMSFFDVFRDLKLVADSGDIRQNYEERYEGIILGDRLRQAMLLEETEDIEAYEELHQDKYQNEFIYRLFQLIAIGGSVNQYEDNIEPYLNTTKACYKDLVTVAKDTDSQEIKCFSQVFKVLSIEGCASLFPGKYDEHHPQNVFYVIVDPINWHVTFLYNQWQEFW